MGEKPFYRAGQINGSTRNNPEVVKNPLLVRPESATTESLNSAGKDKGTIRGVNGEEEFVMAADSGRSGSSGDGGRQKDSLSLGEANGEKSVEQDDSRAEEVGEKEEEEGREPKVIKAPRTVSKEERDTHEATHMPFRSWCRHCVRARARNMQHSKNTEQEDTGSKVPRVSMDYFFMSEEDKRACTNPLFIMTDEESKEKYARAVGKKGTTDMDWLIKDIVAELKAWGHQGGEGGELILKSDNEHSIVAVRDAVGKFVGGRIIPEAPPKEESKSNGEIEEAGKTVREFAVVLKDMMEHKAKITVEQEDIVVPWMVRWAAMLISRFKVGNDGKTGYERRRGRKCNIPVVPFGETVWYKLVRETKERKDKFNSEWEEGIRLGQARSSNEAIIGTPDGAVRAYAIRRQDEGNRWQGDRVKNMKGTPSQPDPNKPGLTIPVRVRFDPIAADIPVEELGDHEVVSRRERITPKTLETYRYTKGCDGCLYKRAGLGESKNHSEACRRRIQELRQSDRGQDQPEQGDRAEGRQGQEDEEHPQEQGPVEQRDQDEDRELYCPPEPEGTTWWKPKPRAEGDESEDQDYEEVHPGKWWNREDEGQVQENDARRANPG